MSSGETSIDHFPGNFVWSNAALITKVMAPYEAVGSKRKTLKILTAENGATYHAQADNRQVGVDYIADWITANI